MIKTFVLFIFLLNIGLSSSSQKYKRLVINILQSSNCSPPQLTNSFDLFNQEWKDFNEDSITALGERKAFFLGSYMESLIKKDYLSNKYETNEVSIITDNSKCSIGTAYAYLLGLFPMGNGNKVSKEKEVKAVPPFVAYDDSRLDNIKNILKEDSLQDSQSVFDINLLSNYFKSDTLQYTLKNCKDSYKDYQERYSSSNILLGYLKEYNTKFKESLYNLKILTTNEDISIDKAVELSQCLVLNINNGVTPAVISKIDNYNRFIELSELIYYEYQSNYYYYDINKYLSRVSVSKLITEINYIINDRINKDMEGVTNNYLNFSPKLMLLVLSEEYFTPIIHFFDVTFKKQLDAKYIPASLFHIELYYKNNLISEKPSKTDFYLSIKFNSEVVFDDMIIIYDDNISKKLISDLEIDEFCDNSIFNTENTIYYILIIIFSITFVGLFIFLICLKCRRDRYMKLIDKIIEAEKFEIKMKSSNNMNNNVSLEAMNVRRKSDDLINKEQ